MVTVNDAINDLGLMMSEINTLISELDNLDGDKLLVKIDEHLRDEVIFHLGYEL